MNSSNAEFALIATVAILVLFVIRLELRIRKLLRGNTVDNVEEAMVNAFKDIEKLHNAKNEIEKEIGVINGKIKKNIRTIGTVRFNPFSDVGGKQSFASAFIDSEGDGVVLSSLFSRDKVSVFAKPIEKFESEYDLSGEEKVALEKAWENAEKCK